MTKIKGPTRHGLLFLNDTFANEEERCNILVIVAPRPIKLRVCCGDAEEQGVPAAVAGGVRAAAGHLRGEPGHLRVAGVGAVGPHPGGLTGVTSTLSADSSMLACFQ